MNAFTTLAGLDQLHYTGGVRLSNLAYRSIVALDSAVTTLLRAVADHYRRKAAIRSLQELDDRTLEDIGVPRSEIAFRVLEMQAAGRASSRRSVLAGRYLQRLRQRYESRREAHASVAALSVLSERMLADIGLSTVDVRALEAGSLSLEELEARRQERLRALTRKRVWTRFGAGTYSEPQREAA